MKTEWVERKDGRTWVVHRVKKGEVLHFFHGGSEFTVEDAYGKTVLGRMAPGDLVVGCGAASFRETSRSPEASRGSFRLLQ